MRPPSTATVDEKNEKKCCAAPASCWFSDFRRVNLAAALLPGGVRRGLDDLRNAPAPGLHPPLHLVDRLGQLLLHLAHLLTDLGRREDPDTGERAEEEEHDEHRADPARDAEPLQPVYAGGQRDAEEDAEEPDEEHGAADPQQLERHVQGGHDPRRPQDVARSGPAGGDGFGPVGLGASPAGLAV